MQTTQTLKKFFRYDAVENRWTYTQRIEIPSESCPATLGTISIVTFWDRYSKNWIANVCEDGYAIGNAGIGYTFDDAIGYLEVYFPTVFTGATALQQEGGAA